MNFSLDPDLVRLDGIEGVPSPSSLAFGRRCNAFEEYYGGLKKCPIQNKHENSHFVKKMDAITLVLATLFRRSTINYTSRGMVGQFIGMWPFAKSMEMWAKKNWKPLMKGEVGVYAHGKGFFIFIFQIEEDKDLIFRSGPYLFSTRG